jgi:hypothetical protein
MMGSRFLAPHRLASWLLATLVLPASAAPPAWLKLGESGADEIYIDTANLENPAGYVKVWTMLSYKRPRSGGAASERRLFLYSCREQTLQWQQSMYYAGPLGEGDLLDVRAWTGNAPGTQDQGRLPDAVPENGFAQVFRKLC